MDKDRLLIIKAELLRTTATPGWTMVKSIANNVVQKMVQEALDEEDTSKGEMRRIKAKALQSGFSDLFASIEATKGFTDEPENDETGLGDL